MSRTLTLCILALLSLSGAQQSKPQPQDQKNASVEGVVVNELTKEPLRRVEVSVMLIKQGGQMGPGQQFSAVTDVEGKFRVAELEAGRYYVNVRKQGFVQQQTMGVGSTNNLQLTAGQELKGLRYALIPQTVIAGRVLDDEGEPVQNANVMVLTHRAMRGKRTWMPNGPNVQTNDKGEFRLTNIAPGKYLVMAQVWQQPMATASTPGQPEMGYVTSYYPGVTDVAQATQVEAKPGTELAGYDIALKKMPVFKIRGRVITVEGQPAKNFNANIIPREGTFFSSFARMSQRREDGSFELSGVPNGAWVIQVRAGRNGPMAQGEQEIASATVDVNGQDVEGLEVRFQPPITVQGNVVIEAATDVQKSVLSTFMVSLTPETAFVMMGGQPARTGQDGAFTAKVNASGKYTISAFSTSASGLYLSSIRIGTQEYFGKAVDMSGGAPGPVKIVFRGDGGKITGTVEIPEEKKGKGKWVAVIVPADPELRNSFTGRNMRPLDQNGGFVAESVRPGEYYLVATNDTDFNAVQEIDQAKDFESKATKVKVTAGSNIAVQLKPFESTDR